ncbi:hypothetical protein HY025_01540 [Candidatus Daviesbacteria bacterium]|nr:hypothetical protein [Candidatus Daviesbacteria bacterium]
MRLPNLSIIFVCAIFFLVGFATPIYAQDASASASPTPTSSDTPTPTPTSTSTATSTPTPTPTSSSTNSGGTSATPTPSAKGAVLGAATTLGSTGGEHDFLKLGIGAFILLTAFISGLILTRNHAEE